MKKKKTIILQNPRLRKARLELRILLQLAKEARSSDLHQCFMSTKDPKLRSEILKKIKALERAYNHSTLGCRLCGELGLDLTHNPGDDSWYCEKCYKLNQNYYKPHPEEANWKKLYP